MHRPSTGREGSVRGGYRRGLVLSALGMALAVPLSAQPLLDLGASPNFVGSGARALGQGNAFIAVADDATAASWNPGGLPQLERPEISLAVEGFRRRSEMSSSTDPTIDSTDTLSLADLNYLSAVYPFRLGARHAVVSLNYLKHYRFDAKGDFNFALREPLPWGPTWENFADVHVRYEQEGSLSSLSPAFGMEVTDRLMLGFALNIWNDDITGDSSFRYRSSEQGQYGIRFMSNSIVNNTQNNSSKDTYTVQQGYSLTLGALYRLSDRWSVGAVVKPPFALHMKHESTYTDYVNPTASDRNRRDADLEFPLVIGGGVAFRPSDPLTLSGDVTWSQWSEYTLDERGTTLNPLTSQSIHTDECEDTVSVRLGAEYLIIREAYMVPLRCGVGYDPGPAVNEIDRFYTGTLGVGLQKGRFALDLAYELRLGRGVNGSAAVNLNAEQDVVQHRLLASVIVYF